MDFKSMANEYYEQAEVLKKTVNKYENMLSESSTANLEYINSKIAQFQSLYNEILNTAHKLEARGSGEYFE